LISVGRAGPKVNNDPDVVAEGRRCLSLDFWRGTPRGINREIPRGILPTLEEVGVPQRASCEEPRLAYRRLYVARSLLLAVPGLKFYWIEILKVQQSNLTSRKP